MPAWSRQPFIRNIIGLEGTFRNPAATYSTCYVPEYRNNNFVGFFMYLGGIRYRLLRKDIDIVYVAWNMAIVKMYIYSMCANQTLPVCVVAAAIHMRW